MQSVARMAAIFRYAISDGITDCVQNSGVRRYSVLNVKTLNGRGWMLRKLFHIY